MKTPPFCCLLSVLLIGSVFTLRAEPLEIRENAGSTGSGVLRIEPSSQSAPSPLAEARNGRAEKAPEPAARKDTAENRCEYLITVANDFIAAAYKNGQLIALEKRELLLDRFGATSEKINVTVRPGDWLVFHVVHNPVRWGGSKYFAVAGCLGPDQHGFVSDPASESWSVCDDPAQAPEFIRSRDAGTTRRAQAIKNPWSEGDELIRRYAGASFRGKALWGSAASTWIKFVAVDAESTTPVGEGKLAKAKPSPEPPRLLEPKRWPVQILSAIYGTGGKNADVTAKVKEHVEQFRRRFASNPEDLGADPNPFWNKGLHVIYMKDGVRREQRRNENEHVLPESFYGPQDAGELRSWLPESRWVGEGGEIQFHADGTFTLPGKEGAQRWEALSAKKLRLTWADKPPLEFVFDHTWSSFAEVESGRNVFHVVR